jgi:hypothetical protein
MAGRITRILPRTEYPPDVALFARDRVQILQKKITSWITRILFRDME